MEAELQKKLYDKYPKLFRQKDLPMTETALCWGLDCGDGWYWLIENLCHSIQGYVDSRNEGVRIRQKAKLDKLFSKAQLCLVSDDEEWQVEATQVKEKFGTLRFYINHGDDYIYGMIWLAEVMSAGICETCGTTENVSPNKGGWVKNLCPKCREEISTRI